MMRAANRAFTALLVLFLVGCKTNVTVDLYYTDLARVAASANENPVARVVMAIQIPSDKECDKYTPKVVHVMAGVVKDFTLKGCTSKQMESYLLGEVQVPVVTDGAWAAADALFGVIVHHGWAFFAMDLDKFKVVNDRMRKEFHQALKVGEATVTIMLHNDGRQAQTYSVMYTLVDGQPFVAIGNFELKPRAKVKLELSNVASRALAKHGRVPVLMPMRQGVPLLMKKG